MNKPKSTVIELTDDMIEDIDDVFDGLVGRMAVPGEYKVWRDGGKIYLEVFHNEP